jgi:hypothetical protein
MSGRWRPLGFPVKLRAMSASALLFWLCLGVDLGPRRIAAIESELAKAQAEVAATYGNRKPSELSSDERRQMIRDQADAERRVLERNEVPAREWAHTVARRSRAEKAEVEREAAAIAEQEKAAQEAARKAGASPKGVMIVRGLGDHSTVTVEDPEAGPVDTEPELSAETQEELQVLRQPQSAGPSETDQGGPAHKTRRSDKRKHR